MSAVGLVGVAWLVLAQAGTGAEKAAGAEQGAQAKPDVKPEEKPGLDVDKLPFTPDSVKQVIEHHLPKIQACYEEMLAGLGGKAKEGLLKTSWEITKEGLVSKAKVVRKGTTLRDEKLHECVVAVLTGMTFPKPPDGKVHPIEYPFNLKAKR